MASKHFIKRISSGWTGVTHRRNWVGWLWLIALGSLSLLGTLWWFWDEPLVSPLSGVTSFHFLHSAAPTNTKPRLVYGFLPYWNLDKVALQPELTHLAYFALTIGSDGQIVTRTAEGTEPGYNKLQSDQWSTLASQMKKQKGQVEMVFSQFDADDITAFLSSDAAHEKFLTSLDSILLAYPVSGINIDIEYNGDVSPNLRQQETAFIHTLRNHLNQKYRHIQLTTDVYASAASNPQLWDIPALAKDVDYFIVMAYDYHRRSSITAGPVAPLFGGSILWENDINQQLKAFLSVVSNHQILLGVPFYGYEWQTTSSAAQATTYPETGATASYERVKTILAQPLFSKLQVTQNWQDTALAPYLTYVEDGKNYVLYYENAQSLAYKLEYVRQLDLAGIAIWALGYEGTSRDLWAPIAKAANAPAE